MIGGSLTRAGGAGLQPIPYSIPKTGAGDAYSLCVWGQLR